MKENKSLELSHRINKLMEKELSGIMFEFYPFELAEKHRK